MIYRIKQSSNICPHCSYGASESSSSHSSPLENQNQVHPRIAIPLKKQVLQHNQNIEQTLTLLQEQVQKLKQQNINKQTKIKDLQSELNQYYVGNNKNIHENNYSKKDSLLRNHTQRNHKFSHHPFKDIRNNKYQFENDQNILIQQNLHSQFKFSPPQMYINKKDKYPQKITSPRKIYKSVSPRKALNDIQTEIRQISSSKNQTINLLTQELMASRNIIKQLKSRVQQQMYENEWLIKFCMSFIKMVTDISNTQGDKVTDPSWSLRKNARNSWKYLKQFMKEVIE